MGHKIFVSYKYADSNVRGISGHVWPSDNQEPFMIRVKIYIIRNKPAIFQFIFYHRMTTVFQTILSVFRNNRFAEIAIYCSLPQ